MKFIFNILGSISIAIFFNFAAFSQPNPYTINIGKIKVTALSDGTVFVNPDILFNISDKKTSQTLKDNYQKNPLELSVNVYLIQTENRNIIIDTGSGSLMGDYGGKLQNQLKKMELDLDDITDILISHIHADHTGGLVMNNQKMFPKATIHIHKNELDYWLNENNKKAASKDHIGANPNTFENAQKMLYPYLQSGQVVTFEKNTEIIKDIQTLLYPGHSPGHTVFVLNSMDEKIYFFGDLIHVQHFQLNHPEIEILFDVNRAEGSLTRLAFYKEAACYKYLIAGSHISFPGFGRIQKNENKFTWVPVNYSEYGRYE